ncbi:DHA2 family efflux MFS transporter permease subunit [Cohnella candidum]|uniref:DHA2 family efflux MFS transporter permease subunit n=1 Tax=Cohnella candidum TaxID=2674991 RepID=A0A3G3JYB6_9BACL|nr:DHA2 family efflux MFS transporter permease subunit [Cohnella candidum]AYQ73235.1 DHA2 family efflux MFS transporter permease subunit [Cohnella candidum]
MELQPKGNIETSPRKGWAFFFLCFGVFMVYLDLMIVNVALPDIRTDMEIGIRGLQWIVDAYAIPFACLLLAAGALGDIVGHKKMFLTGLAGFTLASVWCAESSTLTSLLAARAVQGAFGALMIPVSLAIIRLTFDTPAERAKAIGVWAGIGGIALAAGPLAGGWLVEAFGWKSVFWLNVPVGAAVFLTLSVLMTETSVRAKRSFDVVGQFLSIAGIACLSYGLIESHSLGWDNPGIIASFAGALLSLIAFAVWERRFRDPLLPVSLFRQPLFLVALLVNFLSFFGVFAVMFVMTLYLQNVNGLTAFETGVRFLPLTAAIMVMTTIGGNLTAKIPPVAMIPIGAFAAGGALFWLTSLEPGSGFGVYAWPLLLLGIGLSLAGTSTTVALMNGISPERAGMASGIANTFRQISAVVAVALSGTIISDRVRASSDAWMSSLSIPEEWRSPLQETMASGNLNAEAWRSAGLPADSLEILGGKTADWFAGGMHGAMVLSGIAGIVCGLISLLLLARRGAKRNVRGSAAPVIPPITAPSQPK